MTALIAISHNLLGVDPWTVFWEWTWSFFIQVLDKAIRMKKEEAKAMEMASRGKGDEGRTYQDPDSFMRAFKAMEHG